ncbi:MAG: MBL fold metallo-hydrolase [Chitinophagaceae bacterium]|nr:MAG: MBL fold metallo-hydrolase [Chitinophagaceae bacterium]
MTITFLGTGTSQGVPVIGCDCEVCNSADKKDKRLRTSINIQSEQTTLNIDCGPDFRYQMLKNKIKKMDAVLFTHGHKDHTGGLDDIRAFNFLQKQDMLVFADNDTEITIKKQYDYIFQNHPYPGVPKVKIHHFENKLFEINELEILPILVYHYKMPVFGFRLNDFTYITDANHIPEKEYEKIRGTKTLVLNALRKEKHISHFTLEEAIEIIKDIKPEKAYLTHISHQLGKHADVEKELPENVSLAYDGLKIQIN